jgi:hypothetical protein
MIKFKNLPTLCTVAVLFTLIGCEPKSKPVDPVPSDTSTTEVPPETPPVEKPKETISLKRAHKMYEAYQARFNVLTKFRKGKEDARYDWHSIEFYKTYIAYLEQASKKVKLELSGLRQYYVAYPDDAASGDQKGYQTFIFVPTYFDKDKGKHIAFDPLYIGEDGKPLPIHDIIVNGSDESFAKMLSGSAKNALVADEFSSSIGNFGQMCKPNCSE